MSAVLSLAALPLLRPGAGGGATDTSSAEVIRSWMRGHRMWQTLDFVGSSPADQGRVSEATARTTTTSTMAVAVASLLPLGGSSQLAALILCQGWPDEDWVSSPLMRVQSVLPRTPLAFAMPRQDASAPLLALDFGMRLIRTTPEATQVAIICVDCLVPPYPRTWGTLTTFEDAAGAILIGSPTEVAPHIVAVRIATGEAEPPPRVWALSTSEAFHIHVDPLVPLIEDLLEEAGISVDQIAYLVAALPNAEMEARLACRLGLKPERRAPGAEGNAGTAEIIVRLAALRDADRLRRGEHVLLAASGLTGHQGACLIEW